jgi:hypothetical protein
MQGAKALLMNHSGPAYSGAFCSSTIHLPTLIDATQKLDQLSGLIAKA